MLRVHVDEAADAEPSNTLDELVAEGARRMLAAALEAEVDAYVTALADERGHRAIALWSATDTPMPGRWSPGPGPSRSGLPGWTTGGSMR